MSLLLGVGIGSVRFSFEINFRYWFGSSRKFKKTIQSLGKIRTELELIVRFGLISIQYQFFCSVLIFQ